MALLKSSFLFVLLFAVVFAVTGNARADENKELASILSEHIKNDVSNNRIDNPETYFSDLGNLLKNTPFSSILEGELYPDVCGLEMLNENYQFCASYILSELDMAME